MKICVVTPRYAIAGVPMAQLRLARALSERGHDVDFLIGRIDSERPVPEVSGVNVVKLNKGKVRKLFFPLWRYLRKAEPHIVFTAEDHLNIVVLLAAICSGSRAKITGSSRVTPFDTYSSSLLSKGWFLKILMRCVMPRANALTCVSKDMIDQYREVFKNPPHVCVYNIVGDNHSRKRMDELVDHPWFLEKSSPLIVAAGSLEQWKGFSDLIRAMKELKKTRLARLVIFGDGSMKKELQTLIDDSDQASEVMLFGNVDNPLKYFRLADIFVLSSYVEGLPNVLVEAMLCGCTPVSTNCPTGPREVLQDGKYGYLVPVGNPVALAAGISDALDRPISTNLLDMAIRPFSEGEVIRRHFEVLGIESPNCNTGAVH